jgi:hypothetical protein
MGRGVEQEEGVGGPKRLPYEAPAITWDEQLPVRPGLVMACNKVDSTAGSGCEFGAPAS